MNATLPPLDRSALEKAKVVSIVAMIFIHCLLFFSLYNDLAPLPSASSLKNKFIICLSFFGLCLPALAGAELRMRIQPFLENSKLQGFSFHKMNMLLVALALLDPLKSIFSSGFYYGMRWDVLPMISLSLFIILKFLKYFSLRRAILILFPSALLAEPLLQKILAPLSIRSSAQAIAWSQSSFFHWPLYIIWLTFIGLSLRYLKKVRVAKIFFAKVLLLLPIFIFLIFFSHYWLSSPTYAAAVINLPLAMFVELGEVGGHMWPMFPWMALVLAGFSYQHLLASPKYKLWGFALDRAGLVALTAFAFFLIFFMKHFSFYYQLLSPKNYFTSSVFQGGWRLALVTISFYICFHYGSYQLSKIWRSNGLVFRLISSGILIIYLVHFILVARMAPLVAKFFHGEMNFFLFFLGILSISLAISGFLVYLYQSKITVRYVRVQ